MSKLLPGVFLNTKKSGEIYYRSSFTYKNKHISLGSFLSEDQAHHAYLEARLITESPEINIADYQKNNHVLSYGKWVSIINFRDNNIYFKTPIYLKSKYFEYYYDDYFIYKFNVDDLFFFSTHKIMKRNEHLFVADYGMHLSILSRYGIKKYAVEGRDYEFINGDNMDFRYENIRVINQYFGVTKSIKNGREIYTAVIHINGNIIIGRYRSEIHAAIAYNKASEFLMNNGLKKNFETNYINDISNIEYAKIYNSVKISNKIRDYFN